MIVWADVKPGDVLHWCLGQMYSNHYLVLEARRSGSETVTLRLLSLLDSKLIVDRRDLEAFLDAGVWTVDRGRPFRKERKLVTRENGRRHAAVRPDVNAGNQRLRTWVFSPPEREASAHVEWVVELGEGRYLRCLIEGKTQVYESAVTPKQGGYSTWWEELS